MKKNILNIIAVTALLFAFSITDYAQAPVYVSSRVNNTTPTRLEMTYSASLANIVPASSAFTVRVNSVSRTVTAVAISGTKVLLFLPNAVIYGDIMTVSYTRPAINQLQSISGELIANLSAQSVTNNVSPGSPVYTDPDGNSYSAIGIGFQIWMKENLKTTKYSDGTAIPNVTVNATWAGLTSAAYCWYNNDAAIYKATYGALYNWYAVDAASNGGKNLCPTGWRVPNNDEWTTLTNYLGGESIAGGKLKETGTTHWASPNTGATNESGFTALPGGTRLMTDGSFNSISGSGLWWSSALVSGYFLAYYRGLIYNDYLIYNNSLNPRSGMSVRCLQNVPPAAEISGTRAVCMYAIPPDITFTGITGTAPYTFTYTINSGSNQSVTTTSGNSVTVSVPTGTAGIYTYSLVSVQDVYSTVAQTGSASVIVNPLPTATISGTTTVCKDVASPNITFTGASGTAPYTFTYTINGGNNQTVTTTVVNSITVAAPTGTAGTFTYALVSVSDASSTACSQTQSGSAIVTVNPLPTAMISGTTAVCKDAVSPNITFTGANGTAPYNFTYTINNGSNQTVTTTVGNSVTVAAPTGTAGTFTYALVRVQDASSTACSQSQSGSAVVTVNPLPTATISGTTAVCKDEASPNITFTGASGTAPYTFTYAINEGSNQAVTTIVGNSVTVAVPTGAAGTFTYNLVSVQDASACLQPQTGSAAVTVNPLPTATISGTTAVCKDAISPNITFTGASGTTPYTFTYTINSGSNQTVTTTVGNSVTVAVPTVTAGTYTYALVSVRDASSAACSQTQSGSAVVTVNPLPTATISGTTAVCKDAPSANITFTGASGTAPYTFTYIINEGSNQTVTTIVGNSVTVAVPNGAAGTFTYNLVSVQDASACLQAQTGSATVTVNPLPTATISGTTAVCKDAASPNITFTGASGTAPYTFTYAINGGSNQTVTTTAGNSVTVVAPTGAAGIFTYTLVSVMDASTTICSQSQNGSAVVTINPIPATSAISGNQTPACSATGIVLVYR